MVRPNRPRRLYMWRKGRLSTGARARGELRGGAVSRDRFGELSHRYSGVLRAAGSCAVWRRGGAASPTRMAAAPTRCRWRPNDVDGFVLWTRNLRPLLPELDAVRRVAPFVVQFTTTGYPRALESSVIAAEEAVAQLREVRRRFGPRAAVWRYDPVVFTEDLDAAAHRSKFCGVGAGARRHGGRGRAVGHAPVQEDPTQSRSRRRAAWNSMARSAGRRKTPAACRPRRDGRGPRDRSDAVQPARVADPLRSAKRAASMPPASPMSGSARSPSARAATGRGAAAPCRATSAPTTRARMAASIATRWPTGTAPRPISAGTTPPRTACRRHSETAENRSRRGGGPPQLHRGRSDTTLKMLTGLERNSPRRERRC